MTTFANLQTVLSRALRDTGGTPTFVAQETADFLNEGITEVSLLAPKQFYENLVVIADALTYALVAGTGPEVEVKRVEVWDITVTPNKQSSWLSPASAEYQHDSQTGWEYYAGLLRITNAIEANLIVGTHQIRVRGYAPYTTADVASGSATDVGMSNEIERAALAYARMQALERLLYDRAKFAQYASQNNASDVTPASLIGDIGRTQAEWRRRSRAITVLREQP